ncbi:putative RNA-directed DNA polymerase, eukaryota, reverse transcriptase zinc-binding domain protein [Tanacetum coccineum]
MERGLRQGAPLSPFLFLLIVEALKISILKACNKGLYKGIFLAGGNDNLSFLQYADGVLFFRKWSRSNANTLILILKCFEEGLKVNLAKSRMFGVGVGMEEVETLATSLGCLHDSISFMYLGLPVGRRMNVCDGIPLYYLSLFKAHVKIINIMESIRARFLWGFKENEKGISWVKWNSILPSRKLGGLGVDSLHAKNLGLLGKWKWRFLSEKYAF